MTTDAPAAKRGSKAKRNRSRSGASTQCPHCRKKLRGEKGLAAHLDSEHGERAQ